MERGGVCVRFPWACLCPRVVLRLPRCCVQDDAEDYNNPAYWAGLIPVRMYVQQRFLPCWPLVFAVLGTFMWGVGWAFNFYFPPVGDLLLDVLMIMLFGRLQQIHSMGRLGFH